MFDVFKAKWLGQVVDYDRVYKYQCVDLILQGLYEMYGIASGVYGNAIAYWTSPTPALLAKFSKIENSEAQKGDIVVFKTVGHTDYNGDGHIGWATGNINATQVEVLEQNGHGGLAPNTSGDGVGQNRIRTRWIDRSRVAGLLRAILVPAAPAVPLPVVHPYTIEAITPKLVKLNKDVNKWGLNYDNFSAINNNPEGHGLAGEIKTVVAILHHNIGYRYYLEDANQASGWNINDCDDYTAPLPPAPAPPVSAPSQQPAGSIISKYQTETYDVLTEMTGYIDANRAINKITDKKTVTIPVGSYYIFNRYFTKGNQELLAINISRTAGTAGAWIAIADNRIPTEEEIANAAALKQAADEAAAASASAQAEADRLAAENAAKLPDFVQSYELFDDIEKYVAMRTMSVIDLEGLRSTLTMPQYGVTPITGMFIVGGIEYLRPKSAADRDWWYGIEAYDPETGKANMELESDVYDDSTSIEERRATGTMSVQDHILQFAARVRELVLKLKSFIKR